MFILYTYIWDIVCVTVTVFEWEARIVIVVLLKWRITFGPQNIKPKWWCYLSGSKVDYIFNTATRAQNATIMSNCELGCGYIVIFHCTLLYKDLLIIHFYWLNSFGLKHSYFWRAELLFGDLWGRFIRADSVVAYIFLKINWTGECFYSLHCALWRYCLTRTLDYYNCYHETSRNV